MRFWFIITLFSVLSFTFKFISIFCLHVLSSLLWHQSLVLTYDDLPGEEDESLQFGTPPPSYHSSHHKQIAAQASLPHVEMVKPAQTQDIQAPEPPKPAKKQELSEEEKRHIIMSEEFHKFFDRATRITERALYYNESADIFIDYTGTKEDMDK